MHGQAQLTSSVPPKCGCDLLRRLISFLGAGVRGWPLQGHRGMSRLTYQGTNICQITTLTQAVTEKANSPSAAAAQSCRWLQQGQEGRAWRGGD